MLQCINLDEFFSVWGSIFFMSNDLIVLLDSGNYYSLDLVDFFKNRDGDRVVVVSKSKRIVDKEYYER